MKKKPLPRVAHIPSLGPQRGPTNADHAACVNKKRYTDREAAADNGCKVYFCPACRFYHRATLKHKKETRLW